MSRYASKEEISAVASYVMKRIHSIEYSLSHGHNSEGTRQLATLRHGLGSFPGANPDAWGVAFEGCSPSLLGHGEMPSDAEQVIYLMLTLYAMHRQGQSGQMHDDEMPIGKSVRRLALESSNEGGTPAMPTAFASLVTADSIDEMEHYLRQVITRLKSSRLKVNYAKLTGQVMRFHNPYRRDGVRLEWSREYTYRSAEEQDATGSES